jgi:hypothetical protein
MRKSVLLGIVVALAACGRDEPGPTAPTPAIVSGSYTLETVDGQALPFLVLDLGAYKAKLASATLNLKADKTYSFAFGIRIEDSGNVRTTSDDDAGTWSISNRGVTLVSNEGSFTRTGTVSGNTLTLESSTRVFVMRK